MDKIGKIFVDEYESYIIKEVSLGEIKDCRFIDYKLIKNPFLKDRFLLIPTLNLLFKELIFPFLYLLVGPFLILFLNKKIFNFLKKYNEYFNKFEINIFKLTIINEKIFYFFIGLILWVCTPIFILTFLIEIIYIRLLFPTYEWSDLKKSIDKYGYDPNNFYNGYLTVDINRGLTLLDGNHRYIILLQNHGKEFKIKVNTVNKIKGEKKKNIYDWDKLKKSIDKYGYTPKKFKKGYLKVKEYKKNNESTYGLLDGNHRYKLLVEKYGNSYSLDVKIRKRKFFAKWEIKKMRLNNIIPAYTMFN